MFCNSKNHLIVNKLLIIGFTSPFVSLLIICVQMGIILLCLNFSCILLNILNYTVDLWLQDETDLDLCHNIFIRKGKQLHQCKGYCNGTNNNKIPSKQHNKNNITVYFFSYILSKVVRHLDFRQQWYTTKLLENKVFVRSLFY